MERVKLAYMFDDQPIEEGYAIADYGTFTFNSSGSMIYGEILWPNGSFKENRPTAIICHGFPGSSKNTDLAYALVRMGCVVIEPNHRGAWGSQGKYLPSNCIEDAINLVHYAQSSEFCEKYHTDTSCVYLIGHSMGGNTVINAAKQLPNLKGVIGLAPFDSTKFKMWNQDAVETMLREEGALLVSDGPAAIYNDIMSHVDEYGFEKAAETFKHMNLCMITGTYDELVPYKATVEPLKLLLDEYDTEAIHRYIDIPGGHGFTGCRKAMIEVACQFVADTANQ